MLNYMELRNGSDIRGVAIASEGGRPVNLNAESVENIGTAFAAWVAERLNKPSHDIRIAIGRDSRLSGERLTQWFAGGVLRTGAQAFDGGMASTPAMFMCCVNELAFDAGVMVTASHLPMERNGFKFFIAEGGLEKDDITSILNAAEAIAASGGEVLSARDGSDANGSSPSGRLGTVDIMTPYISGLKQKILSELGCREEDQPFSGLHVIVDAGNGAGGFFAERLLAPLGADISGSQFLEPDGRFPNHQPNPENPQAMESICAAVRRCIADGSGAGNGTCTAEHDTYIAKPDVYTAGHDSCGGLFGIIFDTDVDRAGAVLPSNGDALALDRNRLIAMMSAILAKQYGPITVVTDSITSTGLSDFIASLGCRHHRFKRGYRNVINEAKRLMNDGENAIFAMETSGHGALYENYFLDDGAYVIVKLLIEFVRARREGRTLNELISALREPAESAEARLPVCGDNFAEYTAEVLAHVERSFEDKPGFTVVKPNYEGVRVNADAAHGDGWFLIRRSLHDPIMPCNLESNSQGGLHLLANALLESIRTFDRLDSEPLEKLSR